jgi:hypothetical protein
MFVACASIANGLFVLNLDDSPICNITAKRPRPNDLSPTYIWHCHFGHCRCFRPATYQGEYSR